MSVEAKQLAEAGGIDTEDRTRQKSRVGMEAIMTWQAPARAICLLSSNVWCACISPTAYKTSALR
jgi:hypothetical protein